VIVTAGEVGVPASAVGATASKPRAIPAAAAASLMRMADVPPISHGKFPQGVYPWAYRGETVILG
jgi:hypothetical protein